MSPRAASSRTTASRYSPSAVKCYSWTIWPSTSRPAAAGIIVPKHHLPEPDCLHAAAQDARGGVPRRRRLAAGGRVQSLFRREDLDPDPRQDASQENQTIAFFKFEKDGYGLGAQRRPLCSIMRQTGTLPSAQRPAASPSRDWRIPARLRAGESSRTSSLRSD